MRGIVRRQGVGRRVHAVSGRAPAAGACLALICLLSLPSVMRGENFPGADSVFQPGEELVYNVSYGSFDIGRVRIRLTEAVPHGGSVLYRAVANIDSYDGVPLVNLHAFFSSLIDPSVHSTWFTARQKDDDKWTEWTYTFDYPRRFLAMDRGIWKSGVIDWRDTLRIDTLSQDGLSLFYLARCAVLTPRVMNVPTIVKEKKGTTLLRMTGERAKETIDAIKYPVDVIHFDGEAKFIGIFGLTGGFEGWFTNDAARVPVVAKMKVFIGSVRLELMSWKRAGWTPPRYAESR